MVLQLLMSHGAASRHTVPTRALLSGITICIVRHDLFKDPWSQMLNSAPVTPLANGQWEARVRALPVSPSPMPEVGLAASSVRRAGPARSTAFAHLKTFIPAGHPRLRRAGREETSTLSNRVSPCTFVAAWSALRFRPGAWSMPNCASPRKSLEYGAGTATTQCNTNCRHILSQGVA